MGQAGVVGTLGQTRGYAMPKAVRFDGYGDIDVLYVAAGGVGSVAVQLGRQAGATVIGLASPPHHAWLSGHGVIPVTYGDGVAQRIGEASGGRVDALIDTYGGGYVDLALELGVPKDR